MAMPSRNLRGSARNVEVMPQRFGGSKVFAPLSLAGM